MINCISTCWKFWQIYCTKRIVNCNSPSSRYVGPVYTGPRILSGSIFPPYEPYTACISVGINNNEVWTVFESQQLKNARLQKRKKKYWRQEDDVFRWPNDRGLNPGISTEFNFRRVNMASCSECWWVSQAYADSSGPCQTPGHWSEKKSDFFELQYRQDCVNFLNCCFQTSSITASFRTISFNEGNLWVNSRSRDELQIENLWKMSRLLQATQRVRSIENVLYHEERKNGRGCGWLNGTASSITSSVVFQHCAKSRSHDFTLKISVLYIAIPESL